MGEPLFRTIWDLFQMQERSGQLYSHIFCSLAGIEDLLIPKSLWSYLELYPRTGRPLIPSTLLPHQQILLKINTISLKLAGECNGPQNAYSYFKRKIRSARLFSLGFKRLDHSPLAFLVVQSCVVITLPMQCYIFFFVTSISPASRLLKWTS